MCPLWAGEAAEALPPSLVRQRGFGTCVSGRQTPAGWGDICIFNRAPQSQARIVKRRLWQDRGRRKALVS